MRTLILELLRHGPSHNQLLSPLTPYLALCGNHAAASVQVPFEHGQALHRLRALSYELGPVAQRYQVNESAREMAALLGQVPGLAAGMTRHDGPDQAIDEGERCTQLRLVLSAAELALLPFELTLAPPAMPGAGQPMLLQALQPVCLTREVRRVTGHVPPWPEQPRVLVVIAAPPGTPRPPAEAHVLALRQAFGPWFATEDEGGAVDDARQAERVGRCLTVLSNASVRDIERACASQRYTHVHILAHGVSLDDPDGPRFGLALHDVRNPLDGPMDKVSGERLASVLRAVPVDGGRDTSRPHVVTLASCDSGHQGSVVGTGASVAHALHEAGIPLVIGSQFPLSFGASVRFVQLLYRGLLWGEDPRQLLVMLRRTLHGEFPETHDWASLTAYAALPEDFAQQLMRVQIARAMDHVDATLGFAGDVVWAACGPVSAAAAQAAAEAKAAAKAAAMAETAAKAGTVPPPPAPTPPAAGSNLPTPGFTADPLALSRALTRVDESLLRLDRLRQRHPGQAGRIQGCIASTRKREAEIRMLQSLSSDVSTRPDGTPRPPSRVASLALIGERRQLAAQGWAALSASREAYLASWRADRAVHWPVVQALSTSAVLQTAGQRLGEDAGLALAPLWWLAEAQSLDDAVHGSPRARAWAMCNLLELLVIAPLIPDVTTGLRTERRRVPNEFPPLIQMLHDLVGDRGFPLFSTHRQLSRYLLWDRVMRKFPSKHQPADAKESWATCLRLVGEVLLALPEPRLDDEESRR